MSGVLKEIENDIDIEELESLPPKSKTGTYIGYTISAIFIGLIVYTLFTTPIQGKNQIISWISWSGV